jgi:DNA (cytosine-5)-methyltransferase 1
VRLTVGSLFAGIGGFDLGLERAGFDIRFQVEIDEFCRRVLAKHWPDVQRFGDVRECGAHNLPAVDVLCGGFPCQPHSLAGRRKGAQDERDLWPEFRRLIRELRPRWVLAENVPGLLSNDAGRFFGGILRDLAESGYDAEWDCLPASAFGAPHRRDRVWLVAYPCGDELRDEPGRRSWARGARTALARDNGAARYVADTDESRLERRHGSILPQRAGERIARAGGVLADASGARQPQSSRSGAQVFGREALESAGLLGGARDWWLTEPDVGRVAHGVPAQVDRLGGLGNAIVPQISEWIGRRIIEAEERSAA